jgi:two-component system phosphate regulon sensor histidine kinase PhoR
VTLGFLETLEDAPADTSPEERAHYIQMASTQARRMQSLIEDLLTLSMLETNAQPKDERVDLSRLIESVLADAQALSKNQHEIVLEIDSPAVIHGDESELHSALLNLASNAVHYTPAGGRIVLHWRILDSGDGELGVTDNGIGIAQSDISRLTERFFRADRGRARVGDARGTGLGLAIVKQVVERHHSNLQIRSVFGQGSTFCIVFPADRLT